MPFIVFSTLVVDPCTQLIPFSWGMFGDFLSSLEETNPSWKETTPHISESARVETEMSLVNRV